MNKTLTLICLLFTSVVLAQQGDECEFAYFINDVEDYCSGDREFTTAGSTPSTETNPSCWPQDENNDIWIAIRPQKLGVYVSVTGATQFSQGTLVNPSLAIYEGSCDNLTQVSNLCSSDLQGENVLELTFDEVAIGQYYYLRISARNGNVGSFKLCVQEFNPAKSPESDCKDAVLLCDKSPFYVENLVGEGDLDNEIDPTSCIREEFASVWYKWVCDEPGTLEFTLTPNNAPDDLDFAVYRLPNGLDDCGSKEMIRCMASGETIGAGTTVNDPCFGPTGLSSTSEDTQEFPGCDSGDDNFVSAIDMVAGEAYMLVVNNFSRSGYGFSIEWGGTGTFLGPEPDFTIEALQEFQCDKTIEFVNNSSTITDPIVSYSWNFGAGSQPVRAEGEGPHQTVYESFGNKLAALTIETSRGCRITEVVEFYVEPCCQDTSTLQALADGLNLSCFNSGDGSIYADANRGNPQYQYSLNDGEFQPIPLFSDLDAGEYEVTVEDTKGCRDSIVITLEEPGVVNVNAGQDTTIELGDSYMIDGSISPPGDYTFQWTPDSLFLDCTDCLDPSLFPRTTREYIISATDENGCVVRDTILIRVDIVRRVDGPNVFSPNRDGRNDFFNIFANKAAVGIEELLIYDRWGNKVYEGQPQLNTVTEGWNGLFKDQPVENGTYVWMAKVLFLDGVVKTYSGDVTVVK